MRIWIPTNALWWLGLYGGVGVFVPWLLRWTQRGRNGLDTSPRKMFRRGELGLFGLLLALSAMLDVRRSGMATQLVVAYAVVLGITGFMAASAWLEDYSRIAEGLPNTDERTWVDSRKLLFLAFSIAFTTEVLLEHFAEALPR